VDSATVAAASKAMSERCHPRVARAVIDECIHPHERVGA